MEKITGIKKDKKTGRYSAVVLNHPQGDVVKKRGKIKITAKKEEEKKVTVKIEPKKEVEKTVNVVTKIKRNKK